MKHIPVLIDEVISGLAVKRDCNYIDATIGGGSYSQEILKRNSPGGKVLGIDWNETVIEELKPYFKNLILEDSSASSPPPFGGRPEARLGPEPHQQSSFRPACADRLTLANGNFADIKKIALSYNFKKVCGVVLDLGLSTDLLERSGSGFSFTRDEPLIMTFSKSQAARGGLTAKSLLSHSTEKELSDIFTRYGEERFARKIARAIVNNRKSQPIQTTDRLRTIIESSVGKGSIKTQARIFQAIRIAVNDELENLGKGLRGGWDLLEKEGRLAVVSFHSLEDRIVKRFFLQKKKDEEARIITPKPITATAKELKNNSRSRSAKLRIIEKKYENI